MAAPRRPPDWVGKRFGELGASSLVWIIRRYLNFKARIANLFFAQTRVKQFLARGILTAWLFFEVAVEARKHNRLATDAATKLPLWQVMEMGFHKVWSYISGFAFDKPTEEEYAAYELVTRTIEESEELKSWRKSVKLGIMLPFKFVEIWAELERQTHPNSAMSTGAHAIERVKLSNKQIFFDSPKARDSEDIQDAVKIAYWGLGELGPMSVNKLRTDYYHELVQIDPRAIKFLLADVRGLLTGEQQNRSGLGRVAMVSVLVPTPAAGALHAAGEFNQFEFSRRHLQKHEQGRAKKTPKFIYVQLIARAANVKGGLLREKLMLLLAYQIAMRLPKGWTLEKAFRNKHENGKFQFPHIYAEGWTTQGMDFLRQLGFYESKTDSGRNVVVKWYKKRFKKTINVFEIDPVFVLGVLHAKQRGNLKVGEVSDNLITFLNRIEQFAS